MGRYTGPRERLSRRAGVDLELKGERRSNGKGALERRSTAPGQHGAHSMRRKSVYGIQLQAKQNAKHYYGLRERQLRNLMIEARKAKDVTAGERLLQLCELRLDNVIYRLGFASTRSQARQFVGHGHVDVNGQRCDIPSRRLRPDDFIALRLDSPIRDRAREASDLIAHVPAWLLSDTDGLNGRIVRVPARDEIQVPLEEQQIVEFYSRV